MPSRNRIPHTTGSRHAIRSIPSFPITDSICKSLFLCLHSFAPPRQLHILFIRSHANPANKSKVNTETGKSSYHTVSVPSSIFRQATVGKNSTRPLTPRRHSAGGTKHIIISMGTVTSRYWFRLLMPEAAAIPSNENSREPYSVPTKRPGQPPRSKACKTAQHCRDDQ